METQRPLILVSWISLVWSLLSVKLGARIARWAGFDGLQGAPTRGIPIHNVHSYVQELGRIRTPITFIQERERTLIAFAYLREVARILPIQLFENTWAEDDKTWKLLDRIIFQNPGAALARFKALVSISSQQIGHKFRDSLLVEAHPGLGMTPQQVVDTLREYGANIVWDTFHARRNFLFETLGAEELSGTSEAEILASWQNWRSYLPLLAPFITVVHVQPLRGTDELQRWLKGEQTEMGDMLAELRQECRKHGHLPRYYVVELPPPDGLVGKLIWTVKIPWVMRATAQKLKALIALN